ncbi:MAG: DUF4124 domain-containing protein [Candidatus Methylophosphatis roskildensis]
MQRKLVLFLAILGLAGPADAQVFRWTDKDGRVHYGDDPAPTARNTREVTAPINTLDMSALRRYSADSPSPSSSNSGSGSAAARLPRAAQPQAAATYPNCWRRR